VGDDVEDDDLDESDEEGQHLQLQITIPLDSHNCMRRDCPECGLEFKQRADDKDLGGALADPVGRIARPAQDATPSSKKKAWCPYCGHEADSQDFMHQEHVAYMKQLVYREYMEKMVGKIFDSAFEGFQDTREIQLTITKGPRSARPMLGPEPSDMVPIRCLQCRELFKVLAFWRGSLHCPECATDLVAV